MYNKEIELKLVQDNLGLVFSIVKTFRANAVVDKEDYVQEGKIALIKAARRYKPENGKFSSYAYKAIFNAMLSRQKKSIKKEKILPEDLSYTQKDRLFEFLPDLNEDDVKIITLKSEGYTVKEMVRKLNLDEEHIKNRIRVILKRIKKHNA